jgi:nucleotide-binding universal stress UspA family protein
MKRKVRAHSFRGRTAKEPNVTTILIGYDGSESARAAVLVARALFGAADATVAHVHPPPPTVGSAGIARAALPQVVITEGVTNLRAKVEAEARAVTDAGVEFARSAGLRAEPSVRFALTPWRELLALAAESGADAIVCGTDGEGPIERAVLGSTASSLLHHADRPLLVVPAEVTDAAGPVLAGYDGSDGARAALRFAAAGLSRSRLLVAHAVDSRSCDVDEAVAEEGAAFARSLGLDAHAVTSSGRRNAWRTLLDSAGEQGAAAVLVGSRGRSAVASTVLGSVASGLVHAAALPVLVVPAGCDDASDAGASTDES